MDFDLVKELGPMGAVATYIVFQGLRRVFTNGDKHYLERIAKAGEKHNEQSAKRHTEITKTLTDLDKTLATMKAFSAGRTEGQRRTGD